MSTPNMRIYMFEDEFEKAICSHLIANGVNDPKKQREHKLDADGSVVPLKTPRVETKFLGGGFTREHYWVNTSTGERWLDIFSGVLYLKIVTRRDEKETSHSYLRALCRWLMQQVSTISAKMNLHQIEKMLEQSSAITFEADKIHDVSTLSFQVDLRIRPTAFPQS